jgi:hypothetical protein
LNPIDEIIRNSIRLQDNIKCVSVERGSPTFSFTPEALSKNINQFMQKLFAQLPLPPLLNLEHLSEGVYSVAQLRAGGFTVTLLREGGFTMHQLKQGGFTTADLKAGGFTVVEMKAGGFAVADLKAGGFAVADLKAGGFAVVDLNAGGFTVADLKSVNFTVAELKAGGFSASELLGAGFVVDWMLGGDPFGFRDFDTNIRLIVSASNVFVSNVEYEMPPGYRWATIAEFKANIKPSTGKSYHNYGGWSGYTYGGVERHLFLFRESKSINGFIHFDPNCVSAGSAVTNTSFNYPNSYGYKFAGLVCIRE